MGFVAGCTVTMGWHVCMFTRYAWWGVGFILAGNALLLWAGTT